MSYYSIIENYKSREVTKLSTYQNKTYSMTPKAERELEQACGLLETESKSYALRQLISLGLQQLEKQKETA